ncbi:MAG: thioredoxin family protein [Bacillota bacterium]
MKKLLEVTTYNLEQMIKENNNLLIIFSNPSCGYCQLAKKNLKEIIPSFPNLTVRECIVNDNPTLRDKYKITSVPIFKLIQEGEVVYTGFGVRSADDLYYQLQSFLN